MHHRSRVRRVSLFATVLVAGSSGSAEVIEFGDGEKDLWIDAVGEFTTITFTEFPDNTIITDQYDYLGVIFPNGGVIISPQWEGFPEDGAGFGGPPFSPIWLAFDQPMTHVAVDFPDEVVFRLYSEGDLIYESDEFGGAGAGHFAGLVSTEPFDEVRIWNEQEYSVDIDNLHFGPPIPAPGALAVIGFALLSVRRRRV